MTATLRRSGRLWQASVMPPILAGLGWTKSTASVAMRRSNSMRVGTFPGGNRDTGGSAQLGEAVVVFRRPERLFQPFQPKLLERSRFPSSFVQCPGTVHVEH